MVHICGAATVLAIRAFRMHVKNRRGGMLVNHTRIPTKGCRDIRALAIEVSVPHE